MKKYIMVLGAAVAMFGLTSEVMAGSNRNNNVSSSQSGAGASVNIQSGRGYRPVGTAIAPGLTTSAFSCNGSVSAGAGGSGWGISFGSTVMDKDCNSRENAKIAAQAFGVGVGRKVLCNIKEIAEAAGPAACGSKARALTKRSASAYTGYNQR